MAAVSLISRVKIEVEKGEEDLTHGYRRAPFFFSDGPHVGPLRAAAGRSKKIFYIQNVCKSLILFMMNCTFATSDISCFTSLLSLSASFHASVPSFSFPFLHLYALILQTAALLHEQLSNHQHLSN